VNLLWILVLIESYFLLDTGPGKTARPKDYY